MANDTIFNYIQNFVDGKISREAFWALARFKKPTHQISFHTARALAALSFVKGSEVRDENNSALFYTCSLIEFIGRKKKLKRSELVRIMGEKTIKRIYSYADVFHCEPIEKTADDLLHPCIFRKGILTMWPDAAMLCRITGPSERFMSGSSRMLPR